MKPLQTSLVVLSGCERRLCPRVANIVGVKRDGMKSFIPNDDSILEIGDRIAVAVGVDQFNPALITYGHEVSYFPEEPRVVIVGRPLSERKWLKIGSPTGPP